MDSIKCMTDDNITQTDTEVACTDCEACCCRMEVMLLTETGVPEHYIDTDEWGGRTMKRLDDGWCSALDRHSMLCRIYQKRPLICREFEMGGYECQAERTAAVRWANS